MNKYFAYALCVFILANTINIDSLYVFYSEKLQLCNQIKNRNSLLLLFFDGSSLSCFFIFNNFILVQVR